MTPLPWHPDGSLVPVRFSRRATGETSVAATRDIGRRFRHLDRWWRRAEATCGPATGLRALVDVVAVPLVGILGFRVRAMAFDRARAALDLEARTRGLDMRAVPVAMLVLPWASRPSAAWRDVADRGRRIGTAWGFVLAPPRISRWWILADTLCGEAWTSRCRPRSAPPRRPCSSQLPGASRASCRPPAATASPAAAPIPIDRLVAMSATFADAVRRDLQIGVLGALDELMVAVVRGSPSDRFDEALAVIFRACCSCSLPRSQRPTGAARPSDVLTRHRTIRRAVPAGARGPRDVERASRARGLWFGRNDATLPARLRHGRPHRPAIQRTRVRASGGSVPRTGHRRLARRPSRWPAGSWRSRRVLVSLATRKSRGGREPIDYADLGVEQLGGVYERLLDVGRGSVDA